MSTRYCAHERPDAAFYISFNLSGTTAMLPTFVYAGLAFNSSPAQPAIAALILIPMVLLVATAEFVRRRSRRRFAGAARPAPDTMQNTVAEQHDKALA